MDKLELISYVSDTIEDYTPKWLKFINLLLLSLGVFITYQQGSLNYLFRIIGITIYTTAVTATYIWISEAKENLKDKGYSEAKPMFASLILLLLPFFFFNLLAGLIEIGEFQRTTIAIAIIHTLILTSVYLISLAAITETRMKITNKLMTIDPKSNIITIYKEKSIFEERKKDSNKKFKT